MRGVAYRVGAIGIGCLLALLLLEGLLRIYNPLEVRVRANRISLPASRTYVYKGHGDNAATITHTRNALGFRGPELPPEGLDNYLSIVAVGGSTTECLFLSDGHTWPEVLQQQLEERAATVWVNNAGLAGHSTFGHLVLVRDHVARIAPDVVLFLVGINDVGRDDFSEFAAEHIRDGLQFGSARALVKSLALYSETAALGFSLYRYAKARMRGLAYQKIDLTAREQMRYPETTLPSLLEEHRTRFVPGYEARLRELVRLTRASGIDPVLLTQPALYGNVVDEVTGVDLAGIRVDEHCGHTWWQILELYNEVTRRVGQEEEVFVVDLASELPKSSDNFHDFAHFTPQGAVAVAAILADGTWDYLHARYPGQVPAVIPD